MPADDLPPGWRLVEAGRGTWAVPMHVSRVDSPGWHGWQVRWPGHRRWFSDARCGGCGPALDAAIAHRERHYPGKRAQVRPDLGIRLVRKVRARDGLVQVYVEASHPAGRADRRFYAGTDGTVTAARIVAALELAQAWRDAALTAHLRARRA